MAEISTHTDIDEYAQEEGPFRLVTTVKRGVAPTDREETWERFSTLHAAREAAESLAHDERVEHILIVRDKVPPSSVEWAE